MTGQSKISVMGLYNWDNTLFSLMQIPEGMNLDTVTDNILAETAELEVLYPNPDVMKTLIGVWSHKMIHVWDELYKTLLYEYNPIENYNRYEEGDSSGTASSRHSGTDIHTEQGALGGTDRLTNGGTDTNNGTKNTSGTIGNTNTLGGSDTTATTKNVTSAKSIAGFDSVPSGNSDGLVSSEKTVDTETDNTTITYGRTETDAGTTSGQETTSETHNYGKTETTAYGKTENKSGSFNYGHTVNEQDSKEYANHAHGNIGVTTTQKLIREQREVAEFNVYDRIIKDFMDRFCIMVF